jgi:uncharacterized heparinase superfamily protein
MSDPIGHLRRSIAFARHVPPRQALRRIALSARRAWRDQFGAQTARVDAAPAPEPPTPIFAPRSGMIESSPRGLVFTFLGRAVTMAPAAIDWNAPSREPEHQLWRMHLHYMEYLEEVGDTLLAALIEDWIRANSFARAGAWKDSWNAYALSIRAVVWMQQLALRGERIAQSTRAQAVASLAVQLANLESELETDIGGNHLIKNLKALLWGSAFFRGADARRWRRTGLRLLSVALEDQILSDGVHFERSPSYHAQVFADLLECRHVLGPKDTPPALEARLRAIAQATADLAHPDGLVAQFNDAGLHMAYAPRPCLDAFSRVFGERPTPRASFAFPEAGYFGLRSSDTLFIADCGRIGPDALPAHAHGDALSFEWSVAGLRLIVDPGVFEYVAGPRRAAARSAATHNTLCYDGLDQAEFFGAFRCGRRPNVTVLAFDSGDSHLVLKGTHDGFGAEARHERHFEVEPGRLRIVDLFDAPPSRPARLGFLLHPEAMVARAGDGLLIARGRARIEMSCDATITVEGAVWWPDMGVELPTRRVSVAPDRARRRVVTIFALRMEEEYGKPVQAPAVRSVEAS